MLVLECNQWRLCQIGKYVELWIEDFILSWLWRQFLIQAVIFCVCAFGLKSTKHGGEISTLNPLCIGAGIAGMAPPIVGPCTNGSFICQPCKIMLEKKVTWIRFRSPWATDTLVAFVYEITFQRYSIEICEM